MHLKSIECTEERHTRYMQKQREKTRSEKFSCGKGTLPLLIHSVVHAGISQVTAAVTHAVTEFAKVEPYFERDFSLMEEGSLMQISVPTQPNFLDVVGNRWVMFHWNPHLILHSLNCLPLDNRMF